MVERKSSYTEPIYNLYEFIVFYEIIQERTNLETRTELPLYILRVGSFGGETY